MKGYLLIIRPLNSVMATLGVFTGALVAVGPSLFGSELIYELILAMFSVFFFMGAGNSLNDYRDAEVDAINHPERPIPSGEVTKKAALVVSTSMFIIAGLMAWLINITAFVIEIGATVLMVSYELGLKNRGLPGNLTIALLTSALFLYGGAAVGRAEQTVIFSLLAFSVSVGREIAKDIEDMKGDAGRKTLPMTIGKKKAGRIASSFIVAGVLLSPLPYTLGQVSIYFIPLVVLADAIFIYAAAIVGTDEKKGQKMCKYAMFIALIAFIIGVI